MYTMTFDYLKYAYFKLFGKKHLGYYFMKKAH